jgi:hypothetical protein
MQSTGWFTIGGVGHLFLNPARDQPGQARPVCGVDPIGDQREVDLTGGDQVCPDCDAYLHDRYIPQIS